MADKLRMDYINSLGQLYGMVGGTWWPIALIDVETGASSIDVCGLLDNLHFASFTNIKDENGTEYAPDTFYTDYEETP